MLRSKTYTITTTGGAGTSTGSAQLGLPGVCVLYGVVLDFSASTPATTDVTLTNKGRTITLSTNTATDTVKYPREITQQANGTDVAAGDGERYVAPILHGTGSIDVAQSNNNESVVITLLYEVP